MLDVKVGTRLWYPLDTEKKITNHVQKAKNTTTQSLGLRLHGLQVGLSSRIFHSKRSQIYRADEDRFEHWDKHWGRSLSSDSFEKAVYLFINSSHSRLRYPIASALLKHLLLLRYIHVSSELFF